METQTIRDLAYLVASVLFILDLTWMAHPKTAVRGNWTGALGMAIAIAATVLGQPMTWTYIVVARSSAPSSAGWRLKRSR